MGLNNCAADMQAEAEAWACATLGGNSLDAIEALPHMLLLFRSEARSLVGHGDAHRRLEFLHSDRDRLIGWRIFERVAQIIVDNLAEAVGIADHHQWIIARRFEDDRARGHAVSLIFDGLAHNRIQAATTHYQLKLIGLDARDIEQIANHAVLDINALLGFAQKPLQLIDLIQQHAYFRKFARSQGREPALSKLDIALDAGQGGTQFMAGDAEKLVKTA